MSAEGLISALKTRGVCLLVDGDCLVAEPASKLTETDRSNIRRHKLELIALLARRPLVTAQAEARTLIRTCKEHGVGLRLEADGTLVVTSNGRAWRALINAIEANVDAVAELVLAGWDGSDA